MGRVTYDVPMVTQLQNPICWVTCMAMVASERRGYSVGVGYYLNGFDPTNSSIGNQAPAWDTFYTRLDACGFNSVALNPIASEVESTLRNCGPFILTHSCVGFPYGPGRAPITAPNAMHAVVITGTDSSISGGLCWMNNPWGDKDQPIATTAVLSAISTMLASNIRMVAYYRQ